MSRANSCIFCRRNSSRTTHRTKQVWVRPSVLSTSMDPRTSENSISSMVYPSFVVISATTTFSPRSKSTLSISMTFMDSTLSMNRSIAWMRSRVPAAGAPISSPFSISFRQTSTIILRIPEIRPRCIYIPYIYGRILNSRAIRTDQYEKDTRTGCRGGSASGAGSKRL